MQSSLSPCVLFFIWSGSLAGNHTDTEFLYSTVHILILYIVFLESPSSFNASQGSNVIFHCQINESGNILFWLVNDEFSNSIANQNRSIQLIKYGNLRSILTMPAHTWNNDVEIQCAYRSIQSASLNCSSQEVMCSRKAFLKIQG